MRGYRWAFIAPAIVQLDLNLSLPDSFIGKGERSDF